jgi:hypothetical protein
VEATKKSWGTGIGGAGVTVSTRLALNRRFHFHGVLEYAPKRQQAAEKRQ